MVTDFESQSFLKVLFSPITITGLQDVDGGQIYGCTLLLLKLLF